MPTPAKNPVAVAALAMAVLSTLATTALYVQSSNNAARLEELLQAAGTGIQHAEVRGDDAATSTPAWHGSATTVSQGRSFPLSGSEEAAAIVHQAKRYEVVNPAVVAAEFDGRLASEPRLPEVENQSRAWIHDSVERLPSNMPAARNLDSVCQGRRCTVSAVFADDGQARKWAQHFLLSGGGRVLKNSRTLVTAIPGNAGQVELKLYLF